AAMIAAAHDDWTAASASDARVLDGLDPASDRPGLRHEATLCRLSALAALGRWGEAARLVAEEAHENPTWTVRRAVVMHRAGQDQAIQPSADGDATLSHVRGLLLACSASRDAWDEAAHELAQAASDHRLAGRGDLAAECELQQAELLERLGKYSL